jgi:hypothetical protein
VLSEYPPGAAMEIDGYAYAMTWLICLGVGLVGLVSSGLYAAARKKWARRVTGFLSGFCAFVVFVWVCVLFTLAEYVR